MVQLALSTGRTTCTPNHSGMKGAFQPDRADSQVKRPMLHKGRWHPTIDRHEAFSNAAQADPTLLSVPGQKLGGLLLRNLRVQSLGCEVVIGVYAHIRRDGHCLLSCMSQYILRQQKNLTPYITDLAARRVCISTYALRAGKCSYSVSVTSNWFLWRTNAHGGLIGETDERPRRRQSIPAAGPDGCGITHSAVSAISQQAEPMRCCNLA